MPRLLPATDHIVPPVPAASLRPESVDLRAMEPAPGPDWRRLAAALWRFRWLVLAITLAGTLAAAAATHFISQPYVASATIWIDQGEGQQRNNASLQGAQLLDPEAWLDLLRSYAVLDQVVRDLGLYLQSRPADSVALRGLSVIEQFRPGRYRLSRTTDGAALILATADGMPLDRANPGDSVGRAVGLRWAPPRDALAPGASIRFALVTPRDAARHLADELDTRIDRNGNFLHVDLQGADPKAITAIVNAVAKRYVQVAADLKRQKLTELGRILQQQVDYAQHNLQSAETAYASFRVRTITLPTDPVGASVASGAPGAGPATNDPLSDEYFRDEVARQEAQRDRDQLAHALAGAGDSGIALGALDVIPAVQHDAELSRNLDSLRAKEASLRALRLRYADAYEPVQRLAADVQRLERDIVPGLVRSLIAELDARQSTLARQTTQAAGQLRAAPPRAIEGARLERGLALAQQLFASVQQRFEEVRLAEESSVADVRVLDAAVTPQQPVRNTAPRVLGFGFIGSLGLALVSVVILDRVDPRLRYPEQVSEGLGLTILGAVPHLTGVESRRPAAATTAAVIEALRGIRLNLGYAAGPGPILVTITSSGSGDGKSFVTANLGLSFAEAGRRTLIIDGDIRRGVLHRGLGGTRRPGLVDLLLGTATREQVVQQTRYPGLFLIPSGARRRDAPERLSSPAMLELITAVRSDFDVVLCDSPPLTAGIDPYALSALTGRVLLVLRTGVTRREVTGIKLQVFDRLPVKLLGAVLNDVPWGTVYDSYSYYLPGYEATDEDHGAELPPQRIV